MSEHSPKQTEQPDIFEPARRSPEHAEVMIVELMHYIDALHRLGEEDLSEKYYGLMTDLSDAHIMNDDSFTLEDLRKIHMGPDTHPKAKQAIETAAGYLQESFDHYIQDTLTSYEQIDFSSGHLQVLVNGEHVPVTGVTVEWDQTKSTARLAAQTPAGQLAHIARTRLSVDLSKVPRHLGGFAAEQTHINEV